VGQGFLFAVLSNGTKILSYFFFYLLPHPLPSPSASKSTVTLPSLHLCPPLSPPKLHPLPPLNFFAPHRTPSPFNFLPRSSSLHPPLPRERSCLVVLLIVPLDLFKESTVSYLSSLSVMSEINETTLIIPEGG